MKKNKISLFTIFILTGISLLTTLLNLHSYFSIKNMEKQIVTLKQSITQNSGTDNHEFSDKRTENQTASGNKLSSHSEAVTDNSGNDSSLSQKEEIDRLKRIIQSTGLETFAELNNSYPGIFQEMMEEQLNELFKRNKRKQSEKLLQQQMEPEIKKLLNEPEFKSFTEAYEKTRRSKDASEEEVELALEKIFQRYPDNILTGAAIASYADQMLHNNNIRRAEKYYNKYKEFEDRNPNLMNPMRQSFLSNLEIQFAYLYCQSGETVKLNNILDTLETKYPDETTVYSPMLRDRVPLSEITNLLRRIGNAR